MIFFVLPSSFEICDFYWSFLILFFLKGSKGRDFYMEAENVINAAVFKTWSCLAMRKELKAGSNNKTECCEITRG